MLGLVKLRTDEKKYYKKFTENELHSLLLTLARDDKNSFKCYPDTRDIFWVSKEYYMRILDYWIEYYRFRFRDDINLDISFAQDDSVCVTI